MPSDHSSDPLIAHPGSLIFYLGLLVILFDVITLALRLVATDILSILRPEVLISFPLTSTMQGILAIGGSLLTFVGGLVLFSSRGGG